MAGPSLAFFGAGLAAAAGLFSADLKPTAARGAGAAGFDGTSRIQTVRPGQNRRFHELLIAFGAKTGLACLLNTSLNVMGEPIVETVADARGFLATTPVHGIAVGDHYIRRRA